MFVMEAVSILAFVYGTKFMDAFAKQTVAQNRFVKKHLQIINLLPKQ